MPAVINWPEAIQPLLKKYKNKKHPLDYGNIYQLVVMVVLSAQDSDRNINKLAPEFFKVFPSMQKLSKASPDTLYPLIGGERNFVNKAKCLVEMEQKIKTEYKIPLSLTGLTEL